MAYRPASPNHTDNAFGAELVGVAALALAGIVALFAFAISPLGTMALAAIGALAMWDNASRGRSVRRDERMVTVRRAAYALALLAALFLMIRL